MSFNSRVGPSLMSASTSSSCNSSSEKPLSNSIIVASNAARLLRVQVGDLRIHEPSESQRMTMQVDRVSRCCKGARRCVSRVYIVAVNAALRPLADAVVALAVAAPQPLSLALARSRLFLCSIRPHCRSFTTTQTHSQLLYYTLAVPTN